MIILFKIAVKQPRLSDILGGPGGVSLFSPVLSKILGAPQTTPPGKGLIYYKSAYLMFDQF